MLHVCQPITWSMAAILRHSTVAVAVVRTRARAIPLAMITTRKAIHGFPLVSYMGMGLRLEALRVDGAPLEDILPHGNIAIGLLILLKISSDNFQSPLGE